MEMNIKYKKKYHKYKNKYYKIIQNNKLTGGGETVTIIAVILSIITFFAGVTGIYMNIDAIKNWFKVKERESEQRQLTEKDNRRNAEELDKQKFKKEEAERVKIEADTAAAAAATAAAPAATAAAPAEARKVATATEAREAAAGVPITEDVGLISNNVKKLFNETGTIVPITYYDELNSILSYKDKRHINDPHNGYLNPNIKNVETIKNPITQQQQLHWDFNTRHFYWTPNIINTDKTVYIKYYPKFGDPNDISVYELLTANTFNLYTGKINKLLSPPPPPAAGQKNTN